MKIATLEWSDDDIVHIGAHGIDPVEVEDVCFERHIAIRGRYGRYILYGQTSTGRHIKLVLEKLYDHVYRPVTAYEMSVSEKHNYKLNKSW